MKTGERIENNFAKGEFMNDELKKDIIKSIDIIKESLKNNMQLSIDAYTEANSKLDLIFHRLLKEDLS